MPHISAQRLLRSFAHRSALSTDMAAFSIAEARQMRLEGKTMSARKAHAFLKAWRKKHSGVPAASQGDDLAASHGHMVAYWTAMQGLVPAAPQGELVPYGAPPTPKNLVPFTLEAEDLTDSADFDWKAYVCSRQDRELEAVFEDKTIDFFEIRFLKPIDRNCNQHRCDFVAVRSDKVLVRFHPSHGKDAIPVLALPLDICFTTPLNTEGRQVGLKHITGGPAASQGDGATTSAAQGGSSTAYDWAVPKRSAVFQVVSKHDQMTKKEAVGWLIAKQQRAEADNWAQRFWEDLTDQKEFPWPFLLAGLPGGADMLTEGGVREFLLCWVGGRWQRPAFFVASAKTKEEWVLLLTEKEVWNSEAVKDVRWC